MQRPWANLARNLRLGGIRRNACTESRRLITRRSQVQILPPLLRKALETGPFSVSHAVPVKTSARSREQGRRREWLSLAWMTTPAANAAAVSSSAGAGSTDQTAAPPAPKLVSRSGLDARSAGECSSDCSAVSLTGGRWRRVARLGAGGRPARVRAGVAPHCAAGEPLAGPLPVG